MGPGLGDWTVVTVGDAVTSPELNIIEIGLSFSFQTQFVLCESSDEFDTESDLKKLCPLLDL